MDTFSVNPASLDAAYVRAVTELERRDFAAALWRRSLDVWPGDDAVHKKIAARLGWLDALQVMTPQLERLEAFGASVRDGGFTDVVLLGMGGSSLAPEVMRRVLGTAPGYPRFRILDSVDPDAVRAAMEHAGSTLFILASKSGTTIEAQVMAAEARRRVMAAGHAHWGPRFVVITDEGTPFHRQAIEERFRDVFLNPPDIGGRYSALSYFGLVPAAAMGVNLETLLARAREMERACRETSVTANPGLALGALMAAAATSGRDKLTLYLPERLRALGLWVEQLVAESTGKSGKGIVPIVGESATRATGTDRLPVFVTLHEAPVAGEAQSQVPHATITLHDPASIGAEFLRWEVATATAGLLLGINPFDEPNVQQAKDATRALLDTYGSERRLPAPHPLVSAGGARVSASQAAQDALAGESALAFLRVLKPGDYFGVLAYLPPDDPAFDAPLQELCAAVGERTGCATMLGYGPRYLHSTGQLHKGGPNTGVFLIVAAESSADLDVPGQPFTFGILELAQAIGDFQSLDRAGRRTLYVHLPDRRPDRLRQLATTLLEAF